MPLQLPYDVEQLADIKENYYGLPTGLLKNLIQTESSGNKLAYNKDTGASGLTQIITKYHPTVKNPFDANEALDYTARTLAMYKEEFGSWTAAVAAWHSGEGAVRKAIQQGKPGGVPSTVDKYTGLSTADYVKGIVGITGITRATSALQDRPFDRYSIAVIGLGMVILGGLVLAFRGE